MHDIDIHRLDLNLLVVLDVLLEERSVTRTARRLGRTQSAMSHALGRLREQLADPLLVRVGAEMRPTPKAERLAPDISRLLRALARVLGDEPRFDPLRSTRVFTLAAPDFFAPALVPLVAALAKEAPKAQLEVLPVTMGAFADLADGALDVVVAPPRSSSLEGTVHREVAQLDWVVFARAGHPGLDAWGFEAWLSYPHVRVRTRGGASPVETALQAGGRRRIRGPLLPHFLLGPPLVAGTDLLMTVPSAAVGGLAEAYGLERRPCPLELPPVNLAVHWGLTADRDPALVWFREQVEGALAAMGLG
ncbi:MAG: LysR family transcriptional regulator [Myxococcota bacterium]